MFGLLYKEFASARKPFLVGIGVITAAIVFFLLFGGEPSNDVIIVTVFIMNMHMTSRCFIAEEKSSLLKMLKSMPIKFSNIVTSKYVFSFIINILAITTVLFFSWIASLFGLAILASLDISFVLFVLLIIQTISAVCIMLYYKFGSQYVQIGICVFFAIFALSYMKALTPLMSIFSLDILIIIGVALAIVINILCFIVSVNSIKHKIVE